MKPSTPETNKSKQKTSTNKTKDTKKKDDTDKKEKVECPECSKLLSKKFLKTHIETQHKGGKEKQNKLKDACNEILGKESVEILARSYRIPEAHLNDPMEIETWDDWINTKLNEEEETSFLEMFTGMKLNEEEPSKDKTKETEKKREQEEQKVQIKLEKQTGYQHKNCKAGIIDLFSADDKIIIEIKRWNLYKHALGQLLAYSQEFPGFQLRAHMFGAIPSEDKLIYIVSTFSKWKIQVTWEP